VRKVKKECKEEEIGERTKKNGRALMNRLVTKESSGCD
jgi:hypothetical protein